MRSCAGGEMGSVPISKTRNPRKGHINWWCGTDGPLLIGGLKSASGFGKCRLISAFWRVVQIRTKMLIERIPLGRIDEAIGMIDALSTGMADENPATSAWQPIVDRQLAYLDQIREAWERPKTGEGMAEPLSIEQVTNVQRAAPPRTKD